MSGLDAWIAVETRLAAQAMLRAISATHLVMDRPGFGQRIVPRPGSILASPVPGHYDPQPDYFFHWFRDSSIVVDALRVALGEGSIESSAGVRFREFLEFSLSLRSLDGQVFLRHAGNFRAKVQPSFLEFVRPDAEIAAISGEAVLEDVRVNPDGTLDFIHWSRPQADGPALRCLALLRWWDQFPELDKTLRTATREIISGDLAFTLSHAQKPSFDIWEDKLGYHYYTQLVQMEALAKGAEWLERMGENVGVLACDTARGALATRLDALWNGAAGFYRSRTDAAAREIGNDPDIAVILAVLHAGRATGAHSVLDPRAQATLTCLEELFERQYSINHDRPTERGPAMGRLAEDSYYSGGAYYFATLAAAEFYYSLATALFKGTAIAVTEDNKHFIQRLSNAESEADGPALAAAALRRGDAFMSTVRAYTPASGELSEQFDHKTGAQTSAKHLSWSYAAFITAASGRMRALRALSAASPPGNPASTA